MASVNPLQADKFNAQDIERLRNVVPLHTLTDELYGELLDGLVVENFNKGSVLFHEGDTDHVSFYLLKGKLSLLHGGKVVDVLQAGTEQARFPVAHMLPRQFGARAATQVRVARLDSRHISELLARARYSDYEVDELDEADAGDWMSLLLQSPVLQQLPAENIQRVMMSVEQVEVAKGEDIILQGDAGDYFYMLIQGQALVHRREDGRNEPTELARLGPGDGFGEEALLSDAPRNSSVTMLSDGQVLRLAKADFLELIQSPLTSRIDFETAKGKVAQGAIWVDLRAPDEYERDHFPGSINLPVESLRYQLESLAPDRHYVLYSNSGGRAAVAAFLMTEQGFDVSILEGGLNRLRDETSETAELGVAEPAVGSGSVDAAESHAPDAALQERLALAEQRAQELEQALRQAEARLQEVEQKKRQSLETLKGTVEGIQERLERSEQARALLQEERDRALEEIRVLSERQRQLEAERTELAERFGEQEGREKKLQSHMKKVERELIGERERAESATDALQELERQIGALKEERGQERKQHQREAGELKEQLTALRMELEQLQQENRELQAARDQAENGRSEVNARVAALEESLEAREQALSGLQEQLDALLSEAAERSEALRQRDDELAEVRNELQQLRQQAAELAAQRDGLASELEAARQAGAQRTEELEAELTQRQSELEHEREVLQQAERRLQEMEARLRTTGEENVARVRALESDLVDRDARLEQLAQALDTVRQERTVLQERAAHAEQSLGDAEQRREALEQELQAARAGGDAELKQLHTELERLQQQRDDLQAELKRHEQAAEAAVRAQGEMQEALGERDTELEHLRAELREQAEAHAVAEETLRSDLSERDAELAGLRQELEVARAWEARAGEAAEHTNMLEQQLADALAAQADAEAAQARIAQLQAGLDDLLHERDELLAALETAQAQLREAEAGRVDGARLQEAEAQAADLQSAVNEREQQLAELRKELEAASHWKEEAERLGNHVATLEARIESVSHAEEKAEIAQRELAQLREEKVGAEHELIRLREALEVAEGRLAEEDDARVDALERELAEAHRALAGATEQVDALQAELSLVREEVGDDEEAGQLRAQLEEARQELDRRGRNEDSLQSELKSLRKAAQAFEQHRQSLIEELAERENEVAELRSVMETYVEQITRVQDGDQDQLQALQSEMALLREESTRELTELREQLEQARRALAQAREEHRGSSEGSDAAELEAMRQELHDTRRALEERLHDLETGEENRQLLEDALEDANAEMDRLRREMDRLTVETEEAVFRAEEAGKARDLLQEEILRFQKEVEEAKVSDLRDERVRGGRIPLDIDAVWNGTWLSRLISIALGAGLTLAGLEVLSFLAGRGELIASLLKLTN